MRPATGSHNLRRLRELLGLQQGEFSSVTGASKSYLQKIEYEEKRLTRQMAERIAVRTGISPEWLLRNDPSARPIDSKGNPYTKAQYQLAQARLRNPRSRYLARREIFVPALLLQMYAEARDLFLRREMYKHFFNFLMDLQLLCARYEQKADYPDALTVGDLIKAQERRQRPYNLFPGIIKDAQKCHKSVAAKR